MVGPTNTYSHSSHLSLSQDSDSDSEESRPNPYTWNTPRTVPLSPKISAMIKSTNSMSELTLPPVQEDLLSLQSPRTHNASMPNLAHPATQEVFSPRMSNVSISLPPVKRTPQWTQPSQTNSISASHSPIKGILLAAQTVQKNNVLSSATRVLQLNQIVRTDNGSSSVQNDHESSVTLNLIKLSFTSSPPLKPRGKLKPIMK